MKLEDLQDSQVIFQVIDILCSEYSWTIEYVQQLTIPEISSLIKCICDRKGIKTDSNTKKDMTEEEKKNQLISLAKKMGASKQQLEDLKNGKEVKI